MKAGPRRKFRLVFLTAFVTVAAILVLGETTVRLFSPVEYLYPRYQFSERYGMMLFPDVRMTHSHPGKFNYVYTVNSNSCRGRIVSEDDAAARPTVLILGDSYSFGMGVSDGQEYAAVLDQVLDGDCNVINLACPGWGLTQHIRRFYDFGLHYDPDMVVLQFCANDVDDNFVNRVTVVEDGAFVFQESAYTAQHVKKVLSKSPVQKSQLYNFFRIRAARALEAGFAAREQAAEVHGEMEETQRALEGALTGGVAGTGDAPVRELFYSELLETFAAELKEMDIPLVVIAIDGQMKRFPHIEATVQALDENEHLNYLEVLDWLRNMSDYASIEGHIWGSPAHFVIGRELAVHIRREILTENSAD